MKAMIVSLRETEHFDAALLATKCAERGYTFERLVRADEHPAIAYPHLAGLPKFKELHGPSPHFDIARYETWEAFDLLST